MLLRNLDPSNRLYNGTRLVCRSFSKNVIHAEIWIGDHAGKQVFSFTNTIKPIKWQWISIQVRKRFAIHLFFAMTINKAQEQTIPNVRIYLPMFFHGQLYVPLSRVISVKITKVCIKFIYDNKLHFNLIIVTSSMYF